jgi:hypothetical protein
VGLANLDSESETCVGSRVHLVGVSISIEKNFYRLPFTPPLSGSPYRSFKQAVFGSFFERDFNLPAGDFFRGLLYYYRMELVHLVPNSITVVSTFIHFCEVYLGIPPHFTLWRYFSASKALAKGRG